MSIGCAGCCGTRSSGPSQLNTAKHQLNHAERCANARKCSGAGHSIPAKLEWVRAAAALTAAGLRLARPVPPTKLTDWLPPSSVLPPLSPLFRRKGVCTNRGITVPETTYATNSQ